MAKAKAIECAVCGEEYKPTKKKGGNACPNCLTKNDLSADLEIPINIVKDYVDSIGLGSVQELDKDEIKDNLAKYMNYKTLTKTRRAELELMEIEDRIRSMRNNNNGNGRHDGRHVEYSTQSQEYNTSSLSNPSLLGSTILKMDGEERDKLLTDLSENPEKAYVLSMLLNPSASSPMGGGGSSPLSLLLPNLLSTRALGTQSTNNETGVGAMGEIMASFANSMNGVFSSILEVLTKREENSVKPTEYIKSMAEMINVFKDSQSTQETYMKSMLEMFKMILQNNTPQYTIPPEGGANDIVPVMIEMFKMIMDNKNEGSSELKDKLNQIEEKVVKQNESIKERQYLSQINELKKEIMDLKKGEMVKKEQGQNNTEPLKQLKEQVDLLVDLGIVRKNNDPVVIKENEKGEKVVIPSDTSLEKKGLSIEDRIKLEEWDLKKKKEMLELDLMKLREEHKLRKEMDKEKVETEAEKERYKTLNSLIEGGAAVFSTLLDANTSENKKEEIDKKKGTLGDKTRGSKSEEDELIDIPINWKSKEDRKETESEEDRDIEETLVEKKASSPLSMKASYAPKPVTTFL